MKRLISIISILFVIFNFGFSQCKKGVESQVIINEIGSFVRHDGNGKHTNSEYIELLVIGDANRPFSPIDISGIVIDDNDVDDVEIGTEYGYIKLSDDFPMVLPGSIILIYDQNGFVITNHDDGMPNYDGIYQIPLNSSVIEKYDWGGGNDFGRFIDAVWDDLLPFRNFGDVVQIISPEGNVIHSISWNNTTKELPKPNGSFYFDKTWLSNKSIQLINGDYSNQSSYRVSGYSSPGEPNSPENEKFINDLKNGVINKFGDFKVTIIKNQTKGNQDAEIEVELLGELDPEIKWKVYVDDVEINNPNKDNPFLIKALFGGAKTVRVEIWNEELEQFCPFEKTIEIPIDETVEEEICEGECLTLESEGENCVAWIDEDGNVLSNDDTYTICPEKDVIITELIENANGLVVKRILHNINVKSKSYHLSMIIPDECPPSEVKLRVVGTNLTITWEDGSTEEKKSVSSAGIYKVTVLDENGCTYDETFTVSDDIFNDSDGDGVCDDKDCNPDDNTQTYKKGDPCDDGQACTINDKYDDDCNCVGETPKYGLEVAITGDINICYSQESTNLTADANGGWEPYNILWSTGETTAKILIKEISQDGGETYSVTVTDATGCSESASVQLTRYESDDTDGDGYCDEVDCAKYSAELGGPGSPCDDGDPNTINDKHDENCNCAGVPNPCITDIDGDGVCDECPPEGHGDPNGLVPPCPEKDCNDLDASIGAVGSPCDDGDPNTINDRMNDECECVGELILQDKICLKEVHFKGTTLSGYIPIRKDDNSGFYQAPQYEVEYPTGCTNKSNKTIKTQYPIAYVSGSRANVKAVFETTLNGKYYIRGIGPHLDNTGTNQLLFDSESCNIINGLLVYGFAGANKRFVDNQVKYWQKFKIKWQISDDEINWEDIGESENQLYVTYDKPYSPPIYPNIPFDGHLEKTIAFHTILHLGCKNAQDLTDPDLIVNSIFNNGFSTSGGYNKVYRVDGAGPINYWGTPTGTTSISDWYWKTSGLLATLSGTCGGWAVFFEDVLRIQGIKTSEISTVTFNNYLLSSADNTKLDSDIKAFFGTQEIYVEKNKIKDKNGKVLGIESDFYVKKWDISTKDASGNDIIKTKFVMNEYKNTVNGITPTDFTLNNGNIIKIEEEDGVAGQGNKDPRSEFENHAIVKYNGKYFDPSYGVDSKNTLTANDWENQALDGFGSILKYNDGTKLYYINWIGYLNDNSPQADFNP